MSTSECGNGSGFKSSLSVYYGNGFEVKSKLKLFRNYSQQKLFAQNLLFIGLKSVLFLPNKQIVLCRRK